MARRPMGDLLIFLPGMLGSVLVKDGRMLWGLSPKILPRALQFEQFVRDLTLTSDDPERLVLDDGVVATSLMPDLHLIPGFWKIDGYSSLINAITAQFDVTLGDVSAAQREANFFLFPYDWRRDNRAHAQRLARFIATQLPVWREVSGNADAKVILIAHSMGGLIARYYLECLAGHSDCRALITFGTPYRGSINALDVIMNGQRLFGLFDVSSALRSFTSTYQLLPSYPVIEQNGSYVDTLQVGSVGALDPVRVRAAIEQFIRSMEQPARIRAEAGLPLPYQSLLFIGTNQPTKGSVLLHAGTMSAREDLPDLPQIRHLPGDGDNTVPFYSALPGGTRILDHTLVYASESHSSLQCNDYLHEQLLEQLHVLHHGGDILRTESFAVGQQPSLRLRLADAYPPTGGLIRVEPVAIEGPLDDLLVTLTPLDEESPAMHFRVAPQADAWTLELNRPAPGIYRIQVEPSTVGAGLIRPLHDLFEVFPEG